MAARPSKRRRIARDDDCDNVINQSIRSSRQRPAQPWEIRPPVPTFPRSLFNGFENGDSHSPSISVASEATVLDRLLVKPLTNQSFTQNNDYDLIRLTDFEIYRNGKRRNHTHTLAPLSDLKTANGDSSLVLDGVLQTGSKSFYVRNVEFEVLSIDGYGQDTASVSGLFVQSKQAAKRNVWYRLEDPSKHYACYYNPFLWLAALAKHFVDFLTHHENVTLNFIKAHFRSWLVLMYAGEETFERWLHICNENNLIIAITTYTEFLWKEAVDVDASNRRHFIWREIDPIQLNAIKAQPQKEPATVVTPHVHRCFENCNFQDHLKVVSLSPSVKLRRDSLSESMSLTPNLPSMHSCRLETVDSDGEVSVGDVVAVENDQEGAWKDDGELWYAYVQDIKKDKHGEKYLALIWVYRPNDTICSTVYYPYQNELFLSDHCNCNDEKIRLSDVRSKLKVKLFHTPAHDESGAFVRQTYITPDEESFKDAAFVKLTREHLNCSCSDLSASSESERVKKNFPTGTTALVKRQGKNFLEPVIVAQSKGEAYVRVRQLLRRSRYSPDASAKANELLVTSKHIDIAPKNVIRRCHVRRYKKTTALENRVPAPYSYNGAADCWIVTGEFLDDGTVLDYSSSTLSLAAGFKEGFNPTSDCASPPMNGMSLFGGWGGFDRGLEEGGSVSFKWIVEWAEKALHSHRANLKDLKDAHLFLGSVNDYLIQAQASGDNPMIAKIGSVQVIVAGSPCKGFSRAQLDKMSERSKGHASLVASVLAFINLYCPAYGILENVFDMSRGSGDGDNVFCQIISALVGMGYQAQVFSLDAWAYGSSQTRSRLFISFAAPGYAPLNIPPQTHSHPPHTASRRVGITPSGEKYGFRHFEYCPFEFVSAEESIKDLPDIGEGNVGMCVPFPEHKILTRQAYEKSAVMRWVPRFPAGKGSYYAHTEGLLPEAVLEQWGNRTQERLSHVSKSYMRMRSERLLPTIRTSSHPDDSRHGQVVHWSQNRMMTLQEARRAQSIPDHEILIGLPSQKWEIVGNGVDRKNTVALGMSLREAWLAKETQDKLREHEALAVHEVAIKTAELANADDEGESNGVDVLDEDDARNVAMRHRLQQFRYVQLPGPQLDGSKDAESPSSYATAGIELKQSPRPARSSRESTETLSAPGVKDYIVLSQRPTLQNGSIGPSQPKNKPTIKDSQDDPILIPEADDDEDSVGDCIVLARTGDH